METLFGDTVEHPTQKPTGPARQRVLITVKAAPNPSVAHGGLLSEGYIHGMNHHYEAVLQLRGEAENRQVANAQTALVTSGAGPFGGALIYGTTQL